MENNRIENTNYWIKMFFVCIIGLAINMVGYMIVNAAHLPIYLDSVGTVIIAAIGGYLPGIIAGLATNLLKGAIYSTENVYYAVINVLIAVCTGYFSRRGLLKKPLSILGYVCVLSLIGFGHYTLFQWVTNDIYEGIDSLRAHLYNDMFYEVLDKSVTTIILLLVLKFVPQNIKNKLKMEGWLQTPLSEEEIEAVKQRNSRVFSLKSKILFLLISACVAVGVVAMIITVVLYRKYTIEEHEKMAQGTTSLIKSVIDPDAVDMYIEEGEKAPGYIETEQRLYNIKNSSSDIQYLYVYKIMEDGCHVVFDLDTGESGGRKSRRCYSV